MRFTPGEELASPTTGTVLGTPHTKSGKKLTYERMEDSSNSSPGLRKARVGRVISLGIFPKWFSILSSNILTCLLFKMTLYGTKRYRKQK